MLAAEHPELRIVAGRPRRHEHAAAPEAFPARTSRTGSRPRPASRAPGDRLRRHSERAIPGQCGGPRMSALAFEVPPGPAGPRAAGRLAGRDQPPPLPRPPRSARARRPAGRQHLRDPPRGARGAAPACLISDSSAVELGPTSGHERWVIELRDGDAPPSRRPRRPADRAARRRRAAVRPTSAPIGSGPALSSPLSTTSPSTADRSVIATSPSRARSPTTRRSSPPSPVAPRCRAPGGRSASGDRRSRPRRRDRHDRPAHGRVVARARRAAVPGALPRAAGHARRRARRASA